MGDFLKINAQHYGSAAMPTRMGGIAPEGTVPERAYGDISIFWFLAFAAPEDAQRWYDKSTWQA